MIQNIIDKIFKYLRKFKWKSSSDLILDKNGIEDKDASRRIEIKFIKNEKQ